MSRKKVESKPPKKEKRRKKKKGKGGIIAALIFLILLAGAAGAYLKIASMFTGRLLFNTTVNGMDFSEKAPEEILRYYQDMQEKMNVELTKKDDSTEVLDLSDANYKLNIDISEIDTSFKASLKWPLSYFQPTEYKFPVTVSFDQKKLKKAVHNLECISGDGIVAPADAYMQRGEDGLYEIVPEVEGNTLKEKAVFKMVKESILSGSNKVDLRTGDCYEMPKITKDDKEMNETVSLYNYIGAEEITVDLVDAQEKYSTEEIAKHIKIGEDKIVYVSDAWLEEIVSALAEKYNTFQTEREFTTTDGEKITVGGTKYDTYGFRMDQEKTRLAIQDAIKAKESATVNAVWDVPGIRRDENDPKDDLGGTYIEVSIADQHLWYYKGGELQLESDVVTGNTSRGRGTPKGLCRVWAKQTDRYLRGQGYSSHVNYWMPFNWVNCGLHDATWRSNFGGSIYKSNGSHGCVNMPLKKAKELYGMVAYDTPVIVY